MTRIARELGELLSRQAEAGAFTVEDDPVEAVARARERGVVVRSLPNGWVRASVGWWNDETDIDRLVGAFRDRVGR